MMELKEGMYVRTEKGKIDKIIGFDGALILFLYDLVYGYIDENDIVKASNNIIDLIEVGDYVNGAKVLEIEKDYKFIDGTIRDILWTDTKRNNAIWDENIKSIVTKEQFSSMEYKVN